MQLEKKPCDNRSLARNHKMQNRVGAKRCMQALRDLDSGVQPDNSVT